MNDTNLSIPKISVIMGIYNVEKTLGDAIESIMKQTYPYFELIMCDDGSTDKTYEIAQKYYMLYPDKIVLIQNKTNKGLNYTLNHCLKYAKGEFVARMDGDDMSLPNRFETEINFLEKHPEYGFVSSSLDIYDDNGIWGHTDFIPCPTPQDFIRRGSFSHSALMIRKVLMDEVGGYSEDKRLLRVEDKHLWYKVYLKGHRGYNLSDVLYLYRDDRDGYVKRKLKYRFNSFYVSHLIIRDFKLKKINYIYAVKPIIIGLIPYKLYNYLHKNKLHYSRKKN